MEAGMKSLFGLAALGCSCVFVLTTRAAEGPSRQEVLDLLWHEQFDELEQLTGELRKEKLGFYNGYSKLSTVYGYLDGPGRSAEDRVWQDFLGKLQSWAQARPESATPLIALGDAYIAYAWKARGGGFADTVTEKGWRLFGERLQSARKNLEAAEKMPGKDAEVYRALIVVAMAQGWPRNQMEAVFRKGIEFEPNYQQLYETKAYYLLPRWSGEPGEWETFATEAADTRGEEEGDILYMAIARSQAWSEGAQFFRNTRISYERMKRGFEASLRRYPDSVWEMNSYCYFACIARVPAPVAHEARSLIPLQRPHAVTALLQRPDAQRRGARAAQRGHDRRIGINRPGADFHFVRARRLAGRRVDHQVDLPVLEQVERVRTPFGQLEYAPHFEARLFQHRRRAAGGNDFKAQFRKLSGHHHGLLLVSVAHTDENAPVQRQRRVRGHL